MVADVVCAKSILPVPNAIERDSNPDELNIPVVNVKLSRANVPLVNVVVPVATKDIAAASVVVPAVLLIVSAAIVLPLEVMVPVPRIAAVKLVYVPPLDNVKLFKFKLVAAIVNAVVPKFNKLNQLPVVSVAIDAPLVNVKFGALVANPPVVPNLKVLVTDIILVNPPVPV